MTQRYLAPLLAAAAIGIAGAAQAQPPDRFIQDAIRGDQSEMMLGGLAADRAASPRVRDYGRKLQRDHSMNKQEAIRVARRMRVPNPAGMTPQARAEYSRLKMLRGRAFDREFIRYMVQDHRKDIDEFREQAHSRAPTADYAQRTLPHLEEHLRIAQSLR